MSKWEKQCAPVKLSRTLDTRSIHATGPRRSGRRSIRVEWCFRLSVGRSLREVHLETLRQALKPAGTHGFTVLVDNSVRPNTLSAHGLRVDKDFLLLIPAQLDWKCNKPLHGDVHERRPNTDTLVARRCCVTGVENFFFFFQKSHKSVSIWLHLSVEGKYRLSLC